jgi:hypothetical protein
MTCNVGAAQSAVFIDSKFDLRNTFGSAQILNLLARFMNEKLFFDDPCNVAI